MFSFASKFGSIQFHIEWIKRESGAIIIIKSRTVPATVSFCRTCFGTSFIELLFSSIPLVLNWEGGIIKNKSGDLPFSKQISQTFGIKVEVWFSCYSRVIIH